MNLADLQRRVPGTDLTRLFAEYRAASGSEDLGGFIRVLRDRDLISPEQLKDLHTSGAVEVTLLMDPQKTQSIYDASQRAAEQAADQPDGDDEGEPARYEMLGLLGRGAMGEVHLAQDVFLCRKVAYKSILPQMQTHQQVFTRFLGEMQITSQLDHPYIVPVYGLEVGDGGSVSYAMKLVTGRELAELLDEARKKLDAGQKLEGELALEGRLETFLKVCDAVDFAHSRGILHRDLKPANIMIGRHKEVYVMDWGIARPMGEGGKAADAGIELYDSEGEKLDVGRTRLGQALGTPLYMSPEQAQGLNNTLDGRSDMYSLGLILQEVITLKRAVGATTLQEALTSAKEARRDPPQPHPAVGNVPRELLAVINKATQRRPEDRYPSVSGLAEDVRRYLRNEAVVAQPDTALQAAGRWLSKNRMAALAIMMGLLLAGAGTGIGLLLHQRAVRAEQHQRELRLAEMQAAGATRALKLDRELQRYEAALHQLSGAAQQALSHDLPPAEPGVRSVPAEIFFQADFADGTVPDLVDSPYYRSKMSAEEPVFWLADAAARDANERELQALRSLAHPLREAMLDARGHPAEGMSAAAERAEISDSGVPVRRVVIAAPSGVAMAFPGMADLAAEVKAGNNPAFSLSEEPGIHWGRPYVVADTVVVPCTTPLFDAADRFRGVIGFEVTLDQLLDKLDADRLEYVSAVLLVDENGKIMGRKTTGGLMSEDEVVPIPEVVSAIAAGKVGHLETRYRGTDLLVTFYRLGTIGWYYVALAEMKAMLASEAPVVAPIAKELPRSAGPPRSASPRHPGDTPDPGASAPPPTEPAPSASEAPPEPSQAPPRPPTSRLPWPTPSHAPSAPTPAPSGPPPGPPPSSNPFDPWKVYDKKGGK